MLDCFIKKVNSTTIKNNYGETFTDFPAMQHAVAYANSSSKLSQIYNKKNKTPNFMGKKMQNYDEFVKTKKTTEMP